MYYRGRRDHIVVWRIKLMFVGRVTRKGCDIRARVGEEEMVLTAQGRDNQKKFI